ncbi:unnamed protein product [Orchesella dallaii]|uniref:Cyclic nucleotide-binding domain-containing protein n=1 Tax=Orchesella dallaii TaxID=48710 RepID=A0ABP1QB80_9HEXA
MSEPQERQDGEERFFSVKQKEDKDKRESIQSSLNQSVGSDKVNTNRCLTLRVVQYLLPCLRKKGVWDTSQGDVFKSHDTDETKYPKTLRILENKIFDAIFVCSCLLSIFLFLFSEGFLIESRILWGIIHLVNAVYAMGLFSQWLQILIKSKYAKTNHGYTTKDIVYTLLSVFPADLIVLAIFTLNYDDDEGDATNPIEYWMITVSRLNYFLRVRSILQYLSKWEDNLAVGDFQMFMLRTFLFSSFLLHMFACVWHRLACNSFKLKHFYMTPDEATVDSCRVDSWIGILKTNRQMPLLDHPNWHVLFTHYLVSMYWAIIATFRMGAGDIKTSLVSDLEKAFVSITEITAWIFILASVSGTLTSLLIEKDTEKENFLTRLFSIRTYMSYGKVARSVQDDVTRFYQYLWTKSKGILDLDLVDLMPNAMKAAVYYDINKFVLDQLPMLKDLETPLLMSLSVYTNHRFHMKGEILFKKDEVACGMYYVVKGHLEVLSEDEKHVIVTIRSGSVIGEIHLLQPYPHLATVRCGSDCDILVLTRKHFRRVLNTYPQYIPTLEQTFETRLEESGLLLALAEKHNTYHKVFKALRDMHNNEDTGFHDIDLDHHSFENIMKILEPLPTYEDSKSMRSSEDLDGLNVTHDMEERLLHRSTIIDKAQPKRYEDLVQAALAAIEADVTRAGSLALDLEIHVPPLFVSAPQAATHVTLGFHQKDSENIFVKLGKLLKDPRKGGVHMSWWFIVSTCALLAFWYYPFQFAFRDLSHIQFDYYMHLTDLFFALNCIYDMMQVVVTPQRSFESVKDIAMYRFKSFYFYLRVFSWLPIEYAMIPLVGSGDSLSPWFYVFKFNRLLEIHLVFRFLSEFETRSNISPTILFIGKYILGLFFVSHIFTVVYMFVLRDINSRPTVYVQAFYWAIIVVTSAGFGDRRAETDPEVAAEVLGLMIGVSTVIYMGAKLSSILVNTERRRMSFKQAYYGLISFMKQRKFPKPLYNRVCNYYKLQWNAHEGTLIPTDRPVIWDAPEAFTAAVSNAQTHKYISRIPLFMNAPIELQNEMSIIFKQYIIPPGEVLLYPGELVQDLYIISEGHCEVIYGGKSIAVLSAGRYFGLSGLIFGINTEYKFKTITHCRVFCLDHTNFMKTAQKNPRFFYEFKSLTSEEELSLFQTTDEDEAKAELVYPSEKFMNQLVESSLPEKTNDKQYKSWLRLHFLPNGLVLQLWLIFRVFAALLVTIFAPAQAFFSINPQVSFWTTLAFDIIAWLDMLLEMMPVMFLFMNLTTCLSFYAVCDVSYDGQPITCGTDAWIINGIQSLDYSGALGSAGSGLNNSYLIS